MKFFNKENNITEINKLRKGCFYYDNINNYKELITLLKQIELTYGNLEDIIIKSKNKKNEISYFRRYNDINTFISSFTKEDFENANLYEFSTKSGDYSFQVDNNLKEFTIYQYNFKNKNNVNDENIYYKFDNNLYVKYNKSDLCFYYLDENGDWIFNNALISKIYDSTSKYEIIDDTEFKEKNLKK